MPTDTHQAVFLYWIADPRHHLTTARRWRQWLGAGTAAAVVALASTNAFGEQPSVARRWNEVALEAIRNEAISYAAYRVLVHRYRESPGAEESLPSFDALLAALG